MIGSVADLDMHPSHSPLTDTIRRPLLLLLRAPPLHSSGCIPHDREWAIMMGCFADLLSNLFRTFLPPLPSLAPFPPPLDRMHSP